MTRTPSSVQSKGYDVDRDAVFARRGIRTLRITNESCTRENLKKLIQKAIPST
ncbi:MAG: hypothetical protein HQK66_05025 [Desulfamplus sp.]|nr:hypothetical protein [Desulfamplus sp.]